MADLILVTSNNFSWVVTVHLAKVIEKNIIRLLKQVTTSIADDVAESLVAVRRKSEGLGAELMDAILENIRLAKETGRAVCQDTGLLMIKLVIGSDFPLRVNEILKAVVRGVSEGTKGIPLRPNVVDLVSGKNTGTNIGERSPWFSIGVAEGEVLEVSVMAKGGGSEVACRALSTPPSIGFKIAAELAIDVIAEHGFNSCPPLFIGIGLGGTLATAAEIAYESLLRPVGLRHWSSRVSEYEEYLIELANKLDIGPGGLGGGPTVADVHIETAAHHPACMGIAVVVNCWALRRGKLRVFPDGSVEFFRYRLGGGEWVRP